MTSTNTTLHIADEAWPLRLRGESWPSQLHVRGSLGWLAASAPAVAIVGARAASGHAMEMARELAAAIVGRGGVVVSGGAIGVDAAAHRGALLAGGTTVAVLGCGVDVVYPASHRQLFADVVASGGALVSPFPVGAAPLKGHFVRRNRLIAALADLVVVIGASALSGSLHTARAAVELGRLVAAVPGTPGGEALIAQGAALVECEDDLFAALAGAPRRPIVRLPEQGSEAAAVLASLDPATPFDEEAVASRAGLPLRAVTRALAGLELEGLAVLVPGRHYVRSALATQTL